MTILGKMITIFVFLLAVVQTGFILVTWNTRVNWKADAAKAKAAADDNYKGAEAVKKQADAQKDDSSAEVDAKAKEAERVRDDLKAEIAGYKSTIEAYERKLASDRKTDATVAGLQGQIKSLQDAADLNAKERLRLDAEVVKLTIAAAKSKEQQEGAELEAKAYKAQNERLIGVIQAQEDRISSMKGGTSLVASPPAPENFRGTVKEYKDGFVVITPGLNSGLKPGTVLKIQRLTGGGKYVGTLVVAENGLDPDKAVGTWKRPQGLDPKKETPADQPQPGDEVVANK